MTQKIIKTGLIGALLCLLGLSACSSPTPTSLPTLDLNPFRTEVAATVLAQVTLDLVLTPSAAPLPSSTATTTPTSTPIQSISASPEVTATLANQTPLANQTTAVGLKDLAQWVSQSIADESIFAAGEAFTMTWRLKNVGNSTWTAAYLLRYYSGDLFAAPKEVRLGQEVLPGATIDISLKMKAPAAAGKYRSDWVLSNETRSNFKDPIFLKITVALPPTPTRAPTP